LTERHWKETIDTNLTGVFNTVKASIDALKKTKGYIITIAALQALIFLRMALHTTQVSLDWSVLRRLLCLTFEIWVQGHTLMPGSVATHLIIMSRRRYMVKYSRRILAGGS
jgi:NAD(P)-dependent dehydrogenase (short-subunit alcohol dehydrogenase family)